MRTAALVLMNVASACVAARSGSLITLTIAQATGFLSAGLLLEPHRRSGHRVAAAIGFSCVLLGIAFLIALTGAGHLIDIERTLRFSYRPERLDLLTGAPSILGISSVVLISAGCAIQAGLIPFQSILCDVFEDSPAWDAGIVAVTQRAQALLLLGRIGAAMPGFEHTWQLVLLIVAAGSAVMAAVLVSRCESLRSLSGHAWLLHGGLVTFGVALFITAPDPTTVAIESDRSLLSGRDTVLLAFATGAFALSGVLACENFLRLPDRRIDFFDDLTGLGRQNSLLAAALAIPLLTLIAIPPLPGFWSIVFLAAHAFLPGIESLDSPVLVPSLLVLLSLFAIIAGMLLLAGRVVYLLSLIYFHEPLRRLPAGGSTVALASSVSVAVLLLAFGLLPHRLLEFLHSL